MSVTDANGRPVETDLSSEIEVGGVIATFGSITPRVARSDAATGIATFVYTAPRPGLRAAEEVVTIVVTPEVGGVDSAIGRRVSLRLVPPSSWSAHPRAPSGQFHAVAIDAQHLRARHV